MNKTTTFFVEESGDSLRLDKYLASKLKTLTRSQIKKIILSKNVSINGKSISSPSQKIKSENSIEILIKAKKVEIDSSFPKYIFKNKEKLKKWIA